MSWSTLVVALALAQVEPAPLSPKQLADVKAAAIAFEQGDAAVVIQRLAPLAAKEEFVAILEQELEQRKLPPLGEVMAQARLSVPRDDSSSPVPRPSRNETLLLLPAMKQRLDKMLDDVATRPIMGDVLPLPETLAGFRDVFSQLDAVEGQVEEIEQTATFLRSLARGMPKADLEKLTEDMRAMVANDDAGGLVASLDAIRGGLDERRVEMSIERLKLVVKILAHPQTTPEHLAAAATWNLDVQRASAFLKRPQRVVRRSALKEKDLAKQVTALGEQARKSAGNLAIKARLLHEGLEWWLRGRYGAGPQGGGLVKSVEQMRTPEGRYQLYMPSTTPKPADPFARPQPSPAYPQYQRRHLETWAWTNRYIHTQGWANTKTTRENEKFETRRIFDPSRGGYHRVKTLVSYTQTDEKTASVSRTVFEKENESLLRLVGFLEYAQALARFDQVLKNSTQAELSAMDELVRTQDPFTIYVNLSRSFPQTATTSFRERQQMPDDKFERRGLSWVVALARLELGAMLAAFSSNTESFQRVPPTTYESTAYEELLIDALRMHLWGLQNDPLFNERNLRETALSNAQIPLLYERRVRLALKLIAAVRDWLGQRATNFQREELKQYEDKFTDYLVLIRRDILRLGDDTATSRKVTNVKPKN